MLQIWVKNMETKDIKTEKKEIRKEIKALRAAYTDDQIHQMSLAVCKRLTSLDAYKTADTVYAYVDCKHEVETVDIIRTAWKDGKKVAVPKVIGQEMQFFYITSLEEDLEAGYYGIREPREIHPAMTQQALFLMPGVAFDEDRHRIGYGGGFYDRFLEAHTKMKTAALAFEFQIKDRVPFEPFDIRPEVIVTEQRVIHPFKTGGYL